MKDFLQAFAVAFIFFVAFGLFLHIFLGMILFIAVLVVGFLIFGSHDNSPPPPPKWQNKP